MAAGASSGNSGIGCTGYDAPRGSLERALLRRSIRLHQNLYRSFGLSREHVNKCGSLVVAWTTQEMDKLKEVLDENIEAGDTDVQMLTAQELREVEPSLSHEALGAVLLPHEAVVEPLLVPMAYAESGHRHGVCILTSRNVVDMSFDSQVGQWNVHTQLSPQSSIGRSKPGQLFVEKPSSAHTQLEDRVTLRADFETHTASVIINCAGLFGDVVEGMRRSSFPREDNHIAPTSSHLNEDFIVTPRKGQFIVFDASSRQEGGGEEEGKCIPPQHIIEPVATQFTKGVIVWTTVYGNVIVGPTAVDGEDKMDRSTDQGTIAKLRQYGETVIPSLKYAKVVGTYSGLRPSTQYRDYQIYAVHKQKWITVGGVRSTGLSASSAIGEYVGKLYADMKVLGDDAPVTITVQQPLMGVTESSVRPEDVTIGSVSDLKPMYVPPLRELSKRYKDLNGLGNDSGDSSDEGDNCSMVVELFGRRSRVTHPISSFGMETYKSNTGEDHNIKS